MSVSGGLFEHDPEPDRYEREIVPQRQIKAVQREWAFWGSMLVLLYSAFQGQAMTAFWFTMVIVIVASIKVIAGPMTREIRKTWNG